MIRHKDREHALLSASGAHRWLKCTPSAVLEDREPDKSSEYAREGTLAHEVAELVVGRALEIVKPRSAGSKLAKLRKDPLYSKEMEEHAENYTAYIEQLKGQDGLIMLEQRLDYSKYVPDGFGTGDCCVLADEVLTIIDYKYGKSVKVEAEDNPQMMLYALGAIEAYSFLFDFHSIRMAIYQPRMDNISEFTLSVDNLLKWANGELKDKAKLASEGKGEFVPGDHCQFCRVAGKCRALRDMANADIDSYFDALSSDPPTLSNKEIAEAYKMLDTIKLYTKALTDLALKKALSGENLPGLKLVEGRSVRKYTDQEALLAKLVAAGYSEDKVIKPKELLGITALTKVLGRKKFSEVTEGLIIKPEGKPTLVGDDDPREAISIDDMFTEIKEDNHGKDNAK